MSDQDTVEASMSYVCLENDEGTEMSNQDTVEAARAMVGLYLASRWESGVPIQQADFEAAARRLIAAMLVLIPGAARAYAVRNDQGYWVGIWNTREQAEAVFGRGQSSHREKIIKLGEIE